MKLFYRFFAVPLIVWGAYSGSIPTVLADTPAAMNNSQEAQLSSSTAVQQNTAEEQEPSNNPYLDYNQYSVHPIPQPHILFRKKIWREIYLKEPKNKPFFAKGQEITKFIVEGIKEGAIIPYSDETFTRPMTKEQFLEQISLPKEGGEVSAEEKALGLTTDDLWGDKGATRKETSIKEDGFAGEFFMAHELTILEIMEELIFNKVSATFIHDVQAVTLVIPAEKFPTGLRRIVATLKYKDLVAYFGSKPKEAVWVNVKNNAANMPFAEAIELRLFDSRIVKVENPDNLTLEDTYNKLPNEHLYAAQEIEEQLMELDQFLWEN
jgi:gliding motility associated protien GldN